MLNLMVLHGVNPRQNPTMPPYHQLQEKERYKDEEFLILQLGEDCGYSVMMNIHTYTKKHLNSFCSLKLC